MDSSDPHGLWRLLAECRGRARGGSDGSNPCPYCGGPIESREVDREPGTRITQVAGGRAEARPVPIGGDARLGADLEPGFARARWAGSSFASGWATAVSAQVYPGVTIPGSIATWRSRSSSSPIRASG